MGILIILSPEDQSENLKKFLKESRESAYFANLFLQRCFNGISASYYEVQQKIGREVVLTTRRNIQQQFHGELLSIGQLLDPKKPVLFAFDMDSTVIRQEVIDELARHHGVYDAVAQVTEEAMQGNLDFTEALDKRCSLLKGLTSEGFSIVYKKLTFQPGIIDLFAYLHEKGSKIAIYSGGFVPILEKVAQQYPITHYAANHLEIQDGVLTGKVLGEIVDKEKKRELLLKHRELHGVAREQSVAIGDGSNDSLMLQEAGIGIGFHAKQGLKNKITNWIDTMPHSVFRFLFIES
ncbi:MAG: phosphoserine phosphatase SerB [Spirochaetota bacterium]